LCDYEQALGNQVKFSTHSGLCSWENPIVLFPDDHPFYSFLLSSLLDTFTSSLFTIPGSLQGSSKDLFVVPSIFLYLLLFPAFAQDAFCL